MSRGSQGSRSVFVGNIPYTATEEALQDIFRTVGHVVSFRLVKNPDTGQPKGFGFCEFRDAQTADSAIRNLNNTEFQGRLLRIDYASNVGEGGQSKGGGGGSGGGGGGGGGQGRGGAVNTHELIMGVLGNMSAEQMYEILGQLKTICMQNREQARELFATHPHLALAVMRMQDRLQKLKSQGPMGGGGGSSSGGGKGHDRPIGMAPPDPRSMGGPMGPGGGGGMGAHGGPGGMGGPMGGPPPHMMDMGMGRPYDDGPSGPPPFQGGGPGPNYGPGPGNMGGPPMGMPPNMGGPPPAGMGPPMAMPPPLGGSGGGAPGHPVSMSGPPGGGSNPQNILATLTPEQRQQFQQLLTMTPEQLAQFPPSVQQQVMALQAESRGRR